MADLFEPLPREEVSRAVERRRPRRIPLIMAKWWGDYARVGAACRAARMHFWLHSCGNNTEALDDLIEAGVEVFHPVQKHTMDERAVATEYGDRLTFLVGFDVQHLLREGTPAQVRAEVRHLIDTFDRPDGGLCLAAGNGIVAGTPFENIDAFLDEAVRYGAAHRARFAKS
ncbi:MAG: hypothetical protein FJ290_29410 [Planctomycetes bacterium]|nr:hypothetical protein [Planctomycetota bacterium]